MNNIIWLKMGRYDNIFGDYDCKIQNSQDAAEYCYADIMGDNYEGDVRKHADGFYWHHSSKSTKSDNYWEAIERLDDERFE